MCADGMDRSGLPITDNDAVRNVATQLDRSARLARWFGLGLVAIGVLTMMGSAIATVYMGVQVRGLLNETVAERAEETRLREVEDARRADAARREAQLVNDIMTCLLGQFAEHRHASRDYYNQSAEAHGFQSQTVPGPDLVYDHAKVNAACQRSIRKLDEG